LFARVQLLARNESDAMLVDEKAIMTDQDRNYVYVVGPDDTAVRKDVRLGDIADGLRIVAGLESDDQVIVHGVQKVLYPGMQVDPQPVVMGAPPAQQVAGSGAEAEPSSG